MGFVSAGSALVPLNNMHTKNHSRPAYQKFGMDYLTQFVKKYQFNILIARSKNHLFETNINSSLYWPKILIFLCIYVSNIFIKTA